MNNRVRRRWTSRVSVRSTLVLTSVIMTAAGLTAASAARSAATPNPIGLAGVHTYNKPMCGTNWTTVQTGQSYFHIYNGDFGNYTCISSQQRRLDFQVLKDQSGSNIWPRAYPNISAGWTWGRFSCFDHSGNCYQFPVQERQDGTPTTSVAGWLAPGEYNFAYDIWFNRTDATPNQDNGAEIMIWLAHPNMPPMHTIWRVKIDHIWWDVDTWTAGFGRAIQWYYVAYIAERQRSSVHGLWLNKFFRDAIKHHKLSPYWWLTSIDVGFELTHGGVHNNIHYYTLTGLPIIASLVKKKLR